MIKLLLLSSLFILSSCNYFIKAVEGDNYYETINPQTGSDHVSIVFSHNINGETHPCGCRHFPLGGLAQVHGLYSELSKTKPLIYIDTGDLLFDAPKIPEATQLSKTYTAKKIVQAMNDIGLKIFVPGDQDFAMGIKKLAALLKEAQFSILVGNIKKDPGLNIKKWMKFQLPEKELYITSILSPTLFQPEVSQYLEDPHQSFPQVLEEMKDNGFKENDSSKVLIVLSHSGMDYDEKFASKFQMINWVIGAHTQSFTKFPYEEGKTKLVQVLSRNHYVGELQIPLGKNDAKYNYLIHEIRDAWKDKVKPNPFDNFLTEFKTEVKRIHLEEEKLLSGDFKVAHAPTADSCIQCHEAQADKWRSTAHSIAFQTLIHAQEDANSSCIECHSLKYKEPKGFTKSTQIVLFDQKEDPKKLQEYWSAFKKDFKINSVRSLSDTQRVTYSNKWSKLDEKFGVSHNYANVQCLNCHSQALDHPFEANKIEVTKGAQFQKMRLQCLNCHTPDQSPAWYSSENKKDFTPNDKHIAKMIKQVACPSIKE